MQLWARGTRGLQPNSAEGRPLSQQAGRCWEPASCRSQTRPAVPVQPRPCSRRICSGITAGAQRWSRAVRQGPALGGSSGCHRGPGFAKRSPVTLGCFPDRQLPRWARKQVNSCKQKLRQKWSCLLRDSRSQEKGTNAKIPKVPRGNSSEVGRREDWAPPASHEGRLVLTGLPAA